MQLTVRFVPKQFHSQMASLESALSAQEGAGKDEQTLPGRRSEVQENAAEGYAAIARIKDASPAGACSAAGSDGTHQSLSIVSDRCSYDEAKHGSAALSPCHSSEDSTCLEPGCPEPKQAKVRHVHAPGDESFSPRATEGTPSLMNSSLLQVARGSKPDISATHEGRRKLYILSEEEASSTGCMPAGPMSNVGSGPHLETARCARSAQMEQPPESKAGFMPAAVAHQDFCAADSTLLQSGQTCSAREDATGQLLQDALLQDAAGCLTAASAEGCQGSTDGTQTECSHSLRRAHEHKSCIQPANQNGGHAGSSVRQQQRQTDGTLDLAIALSMVCGLAAVLMCGVMMLASTYRSTSM